MVAAVLLWVVSVTDADEKCRCASCGAAICRSVCRTDCNKCCRCCIYFEMRVGRRAAAVSDADLRDVSGGASLADRRSRSVMFKVSAHMLLAQSPLYQRGRSYIFQKKVSEVFSVFLCFKVRIDVSYARKHFTFIYVKY